MAVVNHHSDPRIKPVDQIPSPIIGTNQRPLHILLLQIIHRANRKPLRVKVGVHQGPGAKLAAMRRDPASQYDCRDWPKMARQA